MKIRAMEAELFRADGQTDVMKLTVASRNFGKHPPSKKINFLFRSLTVWLFTYFPEESWRWYSVCNWPAGAKDPCRQCSMVIRRI